MRDYLVNVLINIPIFEEFSYKIPKFIDKNDIKKGSRVLVPFRNKNVVGIVIGFSVDDKKSKMCSSSGFVTGIARVNVKFTITFRVKKVS